MRKTGRVLGLLVSLALAACGPHDEHPPRGKLTVSFVPQPESVADLTLDTATMKIEHLSVFGNGPPPHVPMPQPFAFDALSVGASFTYPMLPPGVYSVVRFNFDDVMIHGTWRGTPFQVHLKTFDGAMVDLRSATGRELEDLDLTMTVSVDVGTWFDGNLLDGAIVSGGQIVCDDQNNMAVLATLSDRIRRSFVLP